MSASSPVVRSTGAPQITWSRAFPATPQQVGEARRFLAAIVEGRSAVDDAVHCLSELASNAVLHSRSSAPGAQFTVRATLKNDQLRVEVSDDGGPWHWPDGGDDQQHGRGLVIVSRLTTAWGRAGTPDTGWTVWYTINCPPFRLAWPWITVIDGHRLRQLRREHHLSRSELAVKAGISLATVARLERHPQVSCRPRTLSRLAAALGEERSSLAASGEQDADLSARKTPLLSAGVGIGGQRGSS
jgi:anti-sigma regulatory factor (Ser/Thr protein kinase)/DNA-binding XRE family transcriptional regulator